jgi:hypothetical protein
VNHGYSHQQRYEVFRENCESPDKPGNVVLVVLQQQLLKFKPCSNTGRRSLKKEQPILTSVISKL